MMLYVLKPAQSNKREQEVQNICIFVLSPAPIRVEIERSDLLGEAVKIVEETAYYLIATSPRHCLWPAIHFDIVIPTIVHTKHVEPQLVHIKDFSNWDTRQWKILLEVEGYGSYMFILLSKICVGLKAAIEALCFS